MTWLRRILISAGISAVMAPAWAASPRDPSGVWLTEDKRARVKIEKCGPRQEHVCGYVVWLPPAQAANLDRKNPNPQLTNRNVLGHQLMLGLKPNQDGAYEGSIYNAEDGKTYDVTVWLESPEELNVRGCIMGFLCATQSWTRVTDVKPGQLTGATGGSDGPRPNPEWAAKTKSSNSRAAAAARRNSGSGAE